jgi:hypothetical protein
LKICRRIKNWAEQKVTRFIKFVEVARLKAAPPQSSICLWRQVQKRATQESVDFIYNNMTEAVFLSDRFKLINYALKQRTQGLVVEFGVCSGATINFIADRVEQQVHGFDSFEGLPSKWVGFEDYSQAFKRHGKHPRVRKNVTLHIGWFDDTLPKFLEEHAEQFAVIHIDCDIYSSTKTILTNCSGQIKSGTILIFDEFFNYVNWQLHEFKAFQEFVRDCGVQFEYIGYSGNQVAVKIKKISAGKQAK